jgi:hypothetical protein
MRKEEVKENKCVGCNGERIQQRDDGIKIICPICEGTGIWQAPDIVFHPVQYQTWYPYWLYWNWYPYFYQPTYLPTYPVITCNDNYNETYTTGTTGNPNVTISGVTNINV